MYTPLDATIYKEYNKFRPSGPKPLFCYVPFNSMFFTFGGRVLTCPYNQEVELGRYPEKSVHDIWFSNSGKKLREHLEHNDLSNGCAHCLHYFEKKKFTGLKPLVFDKYADYEQGQYPKVLEFSLSTTCNLECKMCDGTVSSSIRKNRDKLPALESPYDDAFIEQLDEFLPHIKEAKFYGGEPFLIPQYFKIWDKILKVNPKAEIFVITNGTVWNGRIQDLLERGNFDLAVSIDGATKETFELIRKNAVYEEVYANLEKFNNYCLAHGKVLNVSFTGQRDNWWELPQMIEMCNRMKAQIYVSYVNYPFHLALWNLKSDKLEEMLAVLRPYKFPDSIYYEKHNKQCFADFLNYLQLCLEKNKAEELKERKAIEEKTHGLSGYKLKEHFYKKIHSYLLNNKNANEDEVKQKYDFYIDKLENIYMLSKHKVDNDTFYSMALSTPTDQIVYDLDTFSAEELAGQITV